MATPSATPAPASGAPAGTAAAGAATTAGSTTSAASASTASQRADVTAIQFWQPFSGQFQLDGMKKVPAAFEQVTPAIAVTMTVDDNDKLIAAVAAGTPPDTVELADSDVIQFGKRSALQPLHDRMAQQQHKTMYEPS